MAKQPNKTEPTTSQSKPEPVADDKPKAEEKAQASPEPQAQAEPTITMTLDQMSALLDRKLEERLAKLAPLSQPLPEPKGVVPDGTLQPGDPVVPGQALPKGWCYTRWDDGTLTANPKAPAGFNSTIGMETLAKIDKQWEALMPTPEFPNRRPVVGLLMNHACRTMFPNVQRWGDTAEIWVSRNPAEDWADLIRKRRELGRNTDVNTEPMFRFILGAMPDNANETNPNAPILDVADPMSHDDRVQRHGSPLAFQQTADFVPAPIDEVETVDHGDIPADAADRLVPYQQVYGEELNK